MNFDFYIPVNLITGKDCVTINSNQFAALGKKALIVTSGTAAKKSGALDDVIQALDLEDIEYIIHSSVEQNPLLQDAYNGGKTCVKENVDFVIGIGGGSPIDAAKAIAVFGANPELELLDVYNLDWKNKALPIVAIGTTAGTGTEMNPFSVLTKPDGRKQSISRSDCFPTISFGDYSYTNTVPLSFTISTALDALSHAVEGYFINDANKISDIFAVEAIKVLVDTLPKLKELSSTKEITEEIREQLYYASICAGVTLRRTSTTYCHSLGYHLTENYDYSHGIACAVFLPGFIKRQKGLMPEKALKLEESIKFTLDNLADLITQLHGVIDLQLTTAEIKQLANDDSKKGSLSKAAPEGVSPEEAERILTELFGK